MELPLDSNAELGCSVVSWLNILFAATGLITCVRRSEMTNCMERMRSKLEVILSRMFLASSLLGLMLLHAVESSYDTTKRTLSEYALSSSSWIFTSSVLSMAMGSGLVLVGVWRRWLLLVWVVGLCVVAVVPTDPGRGRDNNGGGGPRQWCDIRNHCVVRCRGVNGPCGRAKVSARSPTRATALNR